MPNEENNQEQIITQEPNPEINEFSALNNEDLARFENQIKIRNEIKPVYTGYVYDMKENFAKTRFSTTKEMAYDEDGQLCCASGYQ